MWGGDPSSGAAGASRSACLTHIPSSSHFQKLLELQFPLKTYSSELRGSPWLPITCRVTGRHRHVLGLRQPPAAVARCPPEHRQFPVGSKQMQMQPKGLCLLGNQ